MKKIIFLVFLIFPAPLFGVESEIMLLGKLPDHVFGFGSKKIEQFENPQLGASAGYWLVEGDTYSTLTVILFDAGYGPISDGIASDTTQLAFKSAIEDIHTYEKRGYYKDVVAITNGTVRLADRKGLIYQFKGKTKRDGGGYADVRSHLVITGAEGYMLKLRITGGSPSLDLKKVTQITNKILASINR